MARVRKNMAMQGLTGLLGDQFLMRTDKAGRTIVSSRPVFKEGRAFSQAQADHQEAFREAALTVVVGVVVVYLMGGRDRDAAAATGGFIGFSLGAMPVGLAVMRRLNATVGDTPRALLAITLAASLYTDTANAVILALFFRAFGG